MCAEKAGHSVDVITIFTKTAQSVVKATVVFCCSIIQYMTQMSDSSLECSRVRFRRRSLVPTTESSTFA